MRRQGFGNITQGTVTASGDNLHVACRQCLIYQTLCVSRFPGHSNGQLPTLFALVRNGRTNRLVERLLAMQNQQRLAFAH
ncbi:hypothetical protein D3C85_1791970 [compost metagenome]